MLWILATTLTLALAKQASIPDAPLKPRARAWELFRASLQGYVVPDELAIQLDLAEERGELPPGWIVHPKHGTIQLYNAIVHVVTDDDIPEELDRKPTRGWTPVQLFVHAHPSFELEPEDYTLFYALELFIERGRRRQDDYEYALDQPWADAVSIEASLWEREVDELETGLLDGDDLRAAEALAWFDANTLAEGFIEGLRGTTGTAKASSVMHRLIQEGEIPPLDEPAGIEGELAWFPSTTDQYPSDNLEFGDIVERLSEHGIRTIDEEWVFAEDEGVAQNITEFHMGNQPSVRALKHGFVIAQIQDGYNIPYYRNYLVHPVPPRGFFVAPWMLQDKEADAMARRRMLVLEKK